jgi:uncharacterized protein
MPEGAYMIPHFPEFKPLSIEDREPLMAYLNEHHPGPSEYNFTNLFAWRLSYEFNIARFGNGFLILCCTSSTLSFFQPLIREQYQEAVKECFDYLRLKHQKPSLIRVGETFLEALKPDLERYIITEDRDNFDYLYMTQDLIDLPGERYHDKKNLQSQFLRTYECHYSPVTAQNLEKCLAFEHEWCEERECDRDLGLTHEKCSILEMLRNFATLGVSGGIYEVDGKIIALTLGERLSGDTFVLHVEKAKSSMKGSYQAIEAEFLRHAAAECRYTNKEQDLGLEGLRRAKLSYNPLKLVRKFIVTPRKA